MSRIYWDSMLFIYLLENHPVHADRVAHIAERMTQRGDVLYTSAFTYGEVLTGAYRRANERLADVTRSTFEDSRIELIPFTHSTVDRYAQIRARFGFSSPDAIHLACASQEGIDVFLTNDERLVGRGVPGIQFIARMDTDLF